MLAAELLEAGEAFVEDVERGAVAEADAFVVAEGDAGNGGMLPDLRGDEDGQRAGEQCGDAGAAGASGFDFLRLRVCSIPFLPASS